MFDFLNTISFSLVQYLNPMAPSLTSTAPTAPTNGTEAAAKAQEQGLFSQDLVSAEVSAQLPEGYRFRALRRSDYASGFLECLRVLTTVGEISETDFQKQYDSMDAQEGYYIMVIEDTTRPDVPVVATGALIVERKLYIWSHSLSSVTKKLINTYSIHSLGRVGHIEDIAVSKDQQGKKLGLRLIQALDYVAENVGCYKTILDCSEVNEGFYIKCGFRRAGLEMAHYHNKGH